jgi:hypothetical protein
MRGPKINGNNELFFTLVRSIVVIIMRHCDRNFALLFWVVEEGTKKRTELTVGAVDPYPLCELNS